MRHRIVFLPDYDIGMAHALYPGCDVWLNNPLRPLEACGTSGMKAALNGGLNLSIRDGWWDEWYDGENGWAIPTADGVDDPDQPRRPRGRRAVRADREQVAPRFYDRDARRRCRSALDRDGPAHARARSARRCWPSRMVREYVTALYMPAAAASRDLADAEGYQGFGPARELAAWKHRGSQAWPQVRVEHVESEAAGQAPSSSLGSALTVRVSVALGGLTRTTWRWRWSTAGPTTPTRSSRRPTPR